MISRLKKAVDASGKTYKQIAALTGVSESSVSRYLSGEQPPPFDFVEKLADELDLSLDVLAANAHASKTSPESSAVEALRLSYEQRLEDKREHIDSLKARIERLEAAHTAEIERLEKHHDAEIAKIEKVAEDRRKRMDKKNKYIVILFIVIIVVSLASFYCVLDAFNGDWGFIRYELYAVPWGDSANRLSDWFSL